MGTVLRNIQWHSIHNPSLSSVHFNTPSAHLRRHRTPNSRGAWNTGIIKRSNPTITDLDVHPFLRTVMVSVMIRHENNNDERAEDCDSHPKGLTHTLNVCIHLLSLREERHANSTTKPAW